MHVALLNTSENAGGAAIAAGRLYKALKTRVKANYCVINKNSDNDVIAPYSKWFSKKVYLFNLLLEKAHFALHEKNKDVRFMFSNPILGISPRRFGLLKDADIIHLHWINQGFLSFRGLNYIFGLGKPVVWTQHDMWSFTGGCHYAGDCTNYLMHCGNCPLLKKPAENDLSRKIFEKKREIYIRNKNLYIVTCSRWLANKVKQSALFHNREIQVIHNPIDTEQFKPVSKGEVRSKMGLNQNMKYLLFASAKLSDRRKGFSILINALNILHNKYQELHNTFGILLFGSTEEKIMADIPFTTHSFGTLANPASIYQAADIFVLPSLEDNLPNTIMEAMSCGIPCLSFKSGGIPEMIDHKINGYLSDNTTAESLSDSIYKMLSDDNLKKMSENARNSAVERYSEERIAEQYISLYTQLHEKRQ